MKTVFFLEISIEIHFSVKYCLSLNYNTDYHKLYWEFHIMKSNWISAILSLHETLWQKLNFLIQFKQDFHGRFWSDFGPWIPDASKTVVHSKINPFVEQKVLKDSQR